MNRVVDYVLDNRKCTRGRGVENTLQRVISWGPLFFGLPIIDFVGGRIARYVQYAYKRTFVNNYWKKKRKKSAFNFNLFLSLKKKFEYSQILHSARIDTSAPYALGLTNRRIEHIRL